MAFLSSHLCDGHLQVLTICDGNWEGSGDVYNGEESGEEHREEHNGAKDGFRCQRRGALAADGVRNRKSLVRTWVAHYIPGQERKGQESNYTCYYMIFPHPTNKLFLFYKSRTNLLPFYPPWRKAVLVSRLGIA